MRASVVSPDEQYRIIMECRSSGLSDHQWCLEHGIKPGTFYNWVKRLRQKGCSDLPAAAGRSNIKQSLKQDVVKLDFSENESPIFEASDMECQSHLSEKMQPAIELFMGNSTIRIMNEANPVLLAQTLRILKELSC